MKGEKCEHGHEDDKERVKNLIDAIACGNLSTDLHGRLIQWFLNIPENGVAEEVFAEWAAQNIEPDTSTPDKEEKEKFRRLVRILNIKKHKYIIGRNFAMRVAALFISVLIVAGAALFVFDHKENAEEIVFIANDESDNENFTLPDGSNVTLEHGSKLTYSSDFVSDRHVRLDGSAYFEVVRDTVHPFSVHNENLNVFVLGTKFSVKAHENIPEAEVILISGKVTVKIGEHCLELLPNQRLVLDKSKLSVVELSPAGAGTIMRVTGSDLHIDTGDALTIVADYFEKELIIEDGVESDSRLNIILPRDASLESVITGLNELSDDAKFHIDNDTIYVSKKY